MECPESIEELAELEKLIPLCKMTLYEQAQARIKSGAAQTEREASRQLAEELGRDPNTVRQAIKREKVERMGTVYPPKELNFNESEKKLIIKAGNRLKREEKQSRKEERLQAKQEAIEIIKEEAEQNLSDVCDIRHCSMQELLASAKPDCILTDPPYPKKYLNLYLELAQAAKDVPLVAVMCGQSYLPEVMAAMCLHLKYRWTIAYMTPGGQSVQQWQAKVNTFWKPVLLFGEAVEWIGDVAKSNVNDNDKRFHNWGQSESGIADLVERLSKPGDLVCDPFLGGGTTAVCCIALGRKFIGSDTDNDCIEKALARCKSQLARG